MCRDIWEGYCVQAFPACLPTLLEQTALLHFPSVFYKVKVNTVITLFTLISCSVPAKQQIGSQQSRGSQHLKQQSCLGKHHWCQLIFSFVLKIKYWLLWSFTPTLIFSKGSKILFVSFNFLLEEGWNYEQHLIYMSNSSYMKKYIYNCGKYILFICKKSVAFLHERKLTCL